MKDGKEETDLEREKEVKNKEAEEGRRKEEAKKVVERQEKER